MAAIDHSLIKAFPFFSDLSDKALDEILLEARSIRYPKGSTVFVQDDEAVSFFFLLHGHLRVTRVTPSGSQVVVRFIAPGELFGAAAAIGKTRYPATATAVVDVIALAWPHAYWQALMTRHPILINNTIQMVGRRLHEAHNRIIEISTDQVERRIAHALLRLIKQAGRPVEEGVEIDFPISRQDVAEMIGATLHTVSRILSKWEDQGWVKGGRQQIIIRDASRLTTLGAEQNDE